MDVAWKIANDRIGLENPNVGDRLVCAIQPAVEQHCRVTIGQRHPTPFTRDGATRLDLCPRVGKKVKVKEIVSTPRGTSPAKQKRRLARLTVAKRRARTRPTSESNHGMRVGKESSPLSAIQNDVMLACFSIKVEEVVIPSTRVVVVFDLVVTSLKKLYTQKDGA